MLTQPSQGRAQPRWQHQGPHPNLFCFFHIDVFSQQALLVSFSDMHPLLSTDSFIPLQSPISSSVSWLIAYFNYRLILLQLVACSEISQSITFPSDSQKDKSITSLSLPLEKLRDKQALLRCLSYPLKCELHFFAFVCCLTSQDEPLLWVPYEVPLLPFSPSTMLTSGVFGEDVHPSPWLPTQVSCDGLGLRKPYHSLAKTVRLYHIFMIYII